MLGLDVLVVCSLFFALFVVAFCVAAFFAGWRCSGDNFHNLTWTMVASGVVVLALCGSGCGCGWGGQLSRILDAFVSSNIQGGRTVDSCYEDLLRRIVENNMLLRLV